jgi:hypothetical protein
VPRLQLRRSDRDCEEQLMLQRLAENSTACGISPPAGSAVRVLHRDFESRSRAILKTVGTYRYAADRPGLCRGRTQNR